nr:AprI/Inh family metalloprotease inhibitor [uncultured Cohaesibacter sp.]
MSTCLAALGGCAVSGGAFSSGQTNSTPQVISSDLSRQPASGGIAMASGSAVPDKFSQSDELSLAVNDAGGPFGATETKFQQAYGASAGDLETITTQRTSLKPFVGRWRMEAKNTRDKVKRIGSYLGLSDSCELVLEDVRGGYGYKASGNTACPTSLFMLDSWVAFDDQLVLRDHMGDDIVQLRSNGRNVWVGVNKEGNMLVLKKT